MNGAPMYITELHNLKTLPGASFVSHHGTDNSCLMCTHTKRTETPHFTMGIRVTTITTFSSLCLFLKLYALSHTGMPSPPKSTGCRGEMKRVERDRGSSSLVPAHWAPQLPISLKQHCLLMKRISALWS